LNHARSVDIREVLNKLSQRGIINEWGNTHDVYSISVTNKVKNIHPVVDKIVRHLAQIDIIQYIKVGHDYLIASNERSPGRLKNPVSKPDHPSAVGVFLILDFATDSIQFFEMTSAIKGYGGKMVDAVMKGLPTDWEADVVMDWSGGFWDHLAKKYENIVIF
jgi:hypothetical protein